MANKIIFERQNGGIPRSLAGEDHYSGFLMYVPSEKELPNPAQEAENKKAEEAEAKGESYTPKVIPSDWESNPINAISTIQKAESLGITANSNTWEVRALHYHLSECFRINPTITLWVGIFADNAASSDDTDTMGSKYGEILRMQNYAGGKIRQIAVYEPGKELDSSNITLLQGHATKLEQLDNSPLSILYAATVTEPSLSSLSIERATGNKNVSVVIGQDCTPESTAANLYDANNTSKRSVTIIGLVLGMVSKAAVHESIGWVQKFPAGIDVPGFANGVLLRDTDRGDIEKLDGKGLLFLVKHSGLGGSYMNDSHTLDEATSDYASIESVRTMDKAVRGIRTYLLPHLGRPLYVDAETGKLTQDMVTFLQTTAGRQLEDMERAGELSGYVVEVDPEQNVLATSKVEFVIKNVPVGVMRTVSIKIGFTTKLN